MKTYHEFDTDEVWQVVIAWYLSIFVFGFFGINEIRILLISLVAPSQARKIFAKEKEIQMSSSPVDGPKP